MSRPVQLQPHEVRDVVARLLRNDPLNECGLHGRPRALVPTDYDPTTPDAAGLELTIAGETFDVVVRKRRP